MFFVKIIGEYGQKCSSYLSSKTGIINDTYENENEHLIENLTTYSSKTFNPFFF